MFRAYLATQTRALSPSGRPAPQPINVALQTGADWERAAREVEALRLPPHPDRPKNWDALSALDRVLRHTSTTACVLDAGAEEYSSLLPWLALYGYRNLHGINLVFDRPFSRGPIRYVPGDITQSPYPDAMFDAITCLSVIEHGVDVPAFFREARRLLRPGGILVLSCDYHAEPTDTAGKEAYGTGVRVFDARQIRELLEAAGAMGLRATTPVELGCRDRPIRWERLDLDFTFLVLELGKPAAAPTHAA